jgi:cellulose synthase operon protein C
MKSFCLYGVLAAILCVLWVEPARAEPQRAMGPEAELLEATSDVNRVKGAEAYTAVRRVWSQWGALDPERVERTLVDVSTSSAVSPPVRAYAGFVSAHARTRRGDPEGAHRRVANLGFVDHWLVVGPFDNEGKGGHALDLGPEAEFNAPITEGRAFNGKVRPVRWRTLPDAFPFGWLDGGALFRPQQNICFYASTVVWRDGVAPGSKAVQPVSLWVGAGGAYKVFVNGKEVLADAAYRMHDVDRAGASVNLPPGKSRILLKACGLEQAPSISFRVAKADGSPDPTLRFSADFAQTAETVANAGTLTVLKTDLGPIAEFERRVGAKEPKATDLEAYARYLVASSADDPTVHLARDLASRAADLEPTVERLLLAGDLAEDYNQRRQWVTRAETLAASKGGLTAEVLLARAGV